MNWCLTWFRPRLLLSNSHYCVTVPVRERDCAIVPTPVVDYIRMAGPRAVGGSVVDKSCRCPGSADGQRYRPGGSAVEARDSETASSLAAAAPAGGSASVLLRLTWTSQENPAPRSLQRLGKVFEDRIREADAFYDELQADIAGEDTRNVQRQALAGMLWSKQFFYCDVPQWLDGDPGQPPPPTERLDGRNSEWFHLNNADVISMPDKWEYPWYAAWDLAFHCIPLAMIDPGFAKEQLVLMTRERYMHPNGQIPACEWAFGDVNPPVHAWATWRVYKIDQRMNDGRSDPAFLERVFQKLLLNFAWWVNRKDAHGDNPFQGGFLGLDNIGVFDRSAPLPTGGHIEQADGTSWMAMHSLNLLRISLELAERNPVYQDLATKLLEHSLYIAGAMANVHGEAIGLWDEEDEFLYDILHQTNSEHTACDVVPLKVRSMVWLLPLWPDRYVGAAGVVAGPRPGAIARFGASPAPPRLPRPRPGRR